MTGPLAQAPQRFWPRLRHHLGDLLRLAWPVILSRAGILVMVFTDIAMLGRYQAEALAAMNLGSSIFVPLIVFTIGLSSGVLPVAARAFGAGDMAECGRAWCRALAWTLASTALATLVCWQGGALLEALGQAPELAREAGAVARALAPGVMGQAVFAVSAFYLESTRRPLPALVAMVCANIGNLGLDWLLIWGHWGMPEMGAAGAALASSLMRIGAALGLVLFILARPDAGASGVRARWDGIWGPGGWAAGREMRRLGTSAGISNGFETIGFAAMMMFAGQVGTLPLAAYGLALNLMSTLFMVGLGLAVATGVRVGIEMGRGRPHEAAFAGWTGLLAVLLLLGSLSLAVYGNRPLIAAIYTDDPATAARAAGLFAIAALVFVPDCAQVVMGQALRALGDAWVAVACYIGAFVVVMVPLGWALVNLYGLDERALLVAVLGCCLLAAVLLSVRFLWLTRRLCRGVTGSRSSPRR